MKLILEVLYGVGHEKTSYRCSLPSKFIKRVQCL